MDLEHTLSGLLEESVGDLRPPVAEMVVEANRLGGRRRARRRVQLAGAVVAVAALATAGTVVGLDRQHRPASVPELTVAAAPKASPSASPTPTVSAGPMTDLTWQAMLQILAEELPPGGAFKNLDTGMIKFDMTHGDWGLTVQYDDGQGAVTVSVDFARTVGRQQHDCNGWRGGSDEGPRRPGNEAPACYVKTLPDGTVVNSYITGVDSYGLYDESVVIVRPNGEMLHVTSANATLNALGSKPPITVTRDRPPLGLQGWERVIESPKWQFRVPQSLADQGAAFAKTVTRLPCPQPKDCVS